MMFLEAFVESRWATALGWALLHSIWQGGILALLLATVMLATNSPRVRYAAGCLAMLSMLSAFSMTVWMLAPESAQHISTRGVFPFLAWNQVVSQRAETASLSLTPMAPWLTPFWLAGVFLFQLRYVAGFLAVSRLRRCGVCAAPQLWQQKLAALSERLGLTRGVSLLESSLANTPMVLGHFRPVVLMPISVFTGLPTVQLEAILLHELAHIRRHDFLLNTIQNLLDGLFFYHPAAWWISHVVRAEREKCCDDLAVEISGNAREYAHALAALEETRWSGREPAVAAKGGSLMKRIRRLLYPSHPTLAWTPLFTTGVLALAAAVTLGAARQQHPEAPKSRVLQACSDSVNSNAAPISDYHKWLNEDVFYIVDGAERDAFKKLKTDEERNCFVYQFWERRNPTPGAVENKFKAEHYRRITYANAHFAGASLPGWQTDRGHMYIVYGPPDEIDSHPKATPHPYQSWGYRHVEGLGDGLNTFTFVDRTGHGDYHLAPSNGH